MWYNFHNNKKVTTFLKNAFLIFSVNYCCIVYTYTSVAVPSRPSDLLLLGSDTLTQSQELSLFDARKTLVCSFWYRFTILHYWFEILMVSKNGKKFATEWYIDQLKIFTHYSVMNFYGSRQRIFPYIFPYKIILYI